MGDFITLQCPSCGANLRVLPNTLSLKCDACGTEHIIRNDAGNIYIEGYARCPYCKRNDRVQKVTGLEKFHPPSKPINDIEQKKFGCARVLLVLFFGGFGGYSAAVNSFTFVEGVFISLALIIFITGILKISTSAEEFENRQKFIDEVELPKWKKVISIWNKLYYCGRDDCVFIPGTGESVPASEIFEFLYRVEPVE